MVIQIGHHFRPRLFSYELVGFPLMLIGYIISQFDWFDAKLFYVVPGIALGVVYFLSSYALDTTQAVGTYDNTLIKLSAYGWCIGAIGILFYMGNWPGLPTVLLFGVISNFLALFLASIKTLFKIGKTSIPKDEWIRSGLHLIACLGLILLINYL